MRAILNAAGAVQAVGDEPSLVVPDGGQAVDAGDGAALLALLAAATAEQEVAWDGAAFATRPRTWSAEEQAFRADVQTLKTYRTTPKASITPGQTVDAIWALTDMMRRVFRELAD